MNELIAAVRDARVTFDRSDSGEWVRFRCAEGHIRFVVRSRLADGYQAWCEGGANRPVEWHPTADRAVGAGPDADPATR